MNHFVRRHLKNCSVAFEKNWPWELGTNCTSTDGLTSLPCPESSDIRVVSDLFGGSVFWKSEGTGSGKRMRIFICFYQPGEVESSEDDDSRTKNKRIVKVKVEKGDGVIETSAFDSPTAKGRKAKGSKASRKVGKVKVEPGTEVINASAFESSGAQKQKRSRTESSAASSLPQKKKPHKKAPSPTPDPPLPQSPSESRSASPPPPSPPTPVPPEVEHFFDNPFITAPAFSTRAKNGSESRPQFRVMLFNISIGHSFLVIVNALANGRWDWLSVETLLEAWVILSEKR